MRKTWLFQIALGEIQADCSIVFPTNFISAVLLLFKWLFVIWMHYYLIILEAAFGVFDRKMEYKYNFKKHPPNDTMEAVALNRQWDRELIRKSDYISWVSK